MTGLFEAICTTPGCDNIETYASSQEAEQEGWVLWEHHWLCPECWALEAPE